MTYQVPEAIAKANKEVVIFDRLNQFDHRGMVLREVCQLEVDFADLLFAYFKIQNPSVTKLKADKELFSERGLVGSLSKMNRLAHYLGLVDKDESFDIRVLVKLRNMYAHGRDRDQFYRDPKTAAVVRELRLFKNSLSVFADYDEQAIFLACSSHLRELLHKRKASLAASAP